MSTIDHQGLTELTADFHWPDPRPAELGAFFERVLGEPGDDTPAIYATVEWNGPPARRKRFDGLAGWVSALELEPDEALLSVTASGTWRSIHVAAHRLRGSARVSVTVGVSDAAVAAGTALLQRIEQELALTPVGKQAVDADAPTVSVRREYSLVPAAGIDWLADVAAAAGAELGTQVDGSVTVRVDRHRVEHAVRGVDALRDQLRAHGSSVVSVDWYCYAATQSLTAHARLEDRILSVIATATDVAGVDALLALIPESAVAVVGDDAEPTAGVSGGWYTSVPMDRSWFEAACAIVEEIVGPVRSMDGRFSLSGRAGAQEVRRELGHWKADVLTHWDAVVEGYCWLSGVGVSAALRFEPRLDFVHAEIQAPTHLRATELIGMLASGLGLDAIDESARGAWRSAQTFDIGSWGNKLFAEALERAARRAYGTRQPLVDRAFIEEPGSSGAERVPKADLPSFLARAIESRPYGAAEIMLRGARDQRLEVLVSQPAGGKDGARRLHLGSTLGPDEFPDIIAPFKQNLSLKKRAEDTAVERGSVDRTERPWVGDTRRLVFGLISGAVLSSGAWAAAIPRQDLEITLPRPVTGDTMTLAAGSDSTPVEWIVRRRRLFSTRIDTALPATVRVIRNGTAVEHSFHQAHPGLVVPLTTGTSYDIEVRVDEIGERRVVRVTVPAAPTPAGAPGPAPG